MSNPQAAEKTFCEGFNCCQAVLSTYGEEFDLDRRTALRLGTAFGGGIAMMGETCGAVTGAFMLIGLKHGRTDASDPGPRDAAHALARQFVKEFKQRHGSIICKELIGFDLSTPEGLEQARQKGLFTSLCPKLVHDAAEIVEKML